MNAGPARGCSWKKWSVVISDRLIQSDRRRMSVDVEFEFRR